MLFKLKDNVGTKANRYNWPLINEGQRLEKVSNISKVRAQEAFQGGGEG